MLRQVEKYLAMGAVEGWKRGHKLWKNSPTLFLQGALHPHSHALDLQTILWLGSGISGSLLTFQAKGKYCRQPSPHQVLGLLHLGGCPPVMWLAMTGLHTLVKQNCAGVRRGCFYSGWWPSSWSTFLSHSFWMTSLKQQQHQQQKRKRLQMSKEISGVVRERGWKSAFTWSAQMCWSNDPGNMLAKTLETLW